jgi:hypothetical protein
MGKDAANVGEEADKEEQDQGKSQGKKEKGKDKEKHRKGRDKEEEGCEQGLPRTTLTPKQQGNLQVLDKTLMDEQHLGKHAVLLVERVFGSWYRCDDLVPCLTTGRKPIWLTSLGEGQRPQMHQLLRSAEHWGLQGFSPEDILPELSGCTAARASGKAMSVPVVGCFLEQALRFMQQGPAAPSSGSPSFSSSLSTGDGDDAI